MVRPADRTSRRRRAATDLAWAEEWFPDLSVGQDYAVRWFDGCRGVNKGMADLGQQADCTAPLGLAPVLGGRVRRIDEGDVAPGATPLPPPALLVVVALAAAASAQGAYYPSGQRVLALVLVLAAAALVARPHRWAAAVAAPLSGTAMLAVWAVVAAWLHGDPGAAASTVALLAAMAVVLLGCSSLTASQATSLASAVLAIGGLVAVTGWVGVAWRHNPWVLLDGGLWRAATTLTYANAAAGFLAPLALLGVGRLVAWPASRSAAAVTYLLLVGLAATLSRGGALGLAAGAVVLVVLAGARPTARASAAPVAGAVIALAGLVPSMPADSVARPVPALGGLAVGMAVAVGLGDRAPTRRTAAMVGVVVAVAALGLVAFLPGSSTSSIAGRLTLSSPDRGREVGAALRLAASSPVTGVGAGRAELTWVGSDGLTMEARYAHNEYLQVLVELGAVGLGLTVVLLGAVGRTVWLGRTATGSRGLWPGAVAGLAALLVHSGLDFLWHLPVIPLIGAVLVSMCITNQREEA